MMTLVLGTTLWSHIPNAAVAQVEAAMNDYNISFVAPNQKVRAHHTMAEFQKSCHWLKTDMDRNRQQPVVILTHHPPCTKGTSHARYENSPQVLFCLGLARVGRTTKCQGMGMWSYTLQF